MIGTAPERDTIAAISTAPGRAGIAVVRVSGPDSLSIVRTVFTGAHDPGERVRRMVYGRIRNGADTVDEALVCYMKAPRSYTGEDVVEIQTHGGGAVAAAVLSLLTAKGAHPAEPGEFTRRAFLNGRIDLVQAEAVMEIVSSEGREYLRRAEQLMNGAFSEHIGRLNEALASARARMEVNIDFADHDIETVSRDELKSRVEAVLPVIDGLIGSYETASRMRHGLNVVIAGRVNAGKSSLFNVLLGKKRAIVHNRPGTTRDWIEERIEFDGLPVNLIDTAGLRETDDDVEREGVAVTERLIREADMVIHLIDCKSDGAPVFICPPERPNVITAHGKSDLVPIESRMSGRLYLSSITGEGLDKLRNRLIHTARTLLDASGSEPLVMVERHRIHLAKARTYIAAALESIDSWSEEIAAEELRSAEREISSILGKSVTADVLDEIFRNFCMGK